MRDIKVIYEDKEYVIKFEEENNYVGTLYEIIDGKLVKKNENEDKIYDYIKNEIIEKTDTDIK